MAPTALTLWRDTTPVRAGFLKGNLHKKRVYFWVIYNIPSQLLSTLLHVVALQLELMKAKVHVSQSIIVFHLGPTSHDT